VVKIVKTVNIIGAGLAGCEAAYQLLKRGYSVKLFEMKPVKFSPAHKNPNFAELVCSNSLKSDLLASAGGLLKQELREMDSLLISCADKCRVPAGSALAVDREEFAEIVTKELKKFDNLEIINGEVTDLDITQPIIIATGPLTSDNLSRSIAKLLKEQHLYFYDAIAPIVLADTINFSRAFVADRYDKGDGDYINCEMNKEEYDAFYNELIAAKTVELKEFEKMVVYEDCMPVEVLAKRGYKSLLFGPLKPVGLTNPRTGRYPYAVAQLRAEHNIKDSYNMVGFQTNLTFGEQERVFKLIPALKDATFSRFGVMHRNTYVNAPKVLNKFFQLKEYDNIFIAGQLSGVEGYVESIASGLVCGINISRHLERKNLIFFTCDTIIGGLQNYLESADIDKFQPMGANMGLLKGLDRYIKNKAEKNNLLAVKSINFIKGIVKAENLC